MKKRVRINLLLLLLLIVAPIFGGYIVGPHRSTAVEIKKTSADISGGLKTALEILKDDCGRYPTTEEGWKVLIFQPTNDLARGWHGPYLALPNAPSDAWA